MRAVLILCCCVVWLFALFPVVGESAPIGSSANARAVGAQKAQVPGELLVRFKTNLAPMQRQSVRERVRSLHGVRTQVASAQLGIEHWVLPEGGDETVLIRELRESGQVEYAEPNFRRVPRQRVPDDPDLEKQWYVNNTGQEINALAGVAGADMALFDAWQLTTGSRSVKVGLIDDGFELFHPDLEANFDVLAGVNLDGGGLPLPGPADFHGTLLAGVLGAVGNNQTGICGVAWDALMLPIRFDFSVAQEIRAIDYALAQGVDILSLSYGSSDFSKAEKDAFEKLFDAGVLVFIAAGNEGVSNDEVPDYPSNYPFANIISVAASDSSDRMVRWSHFGLRNVDLMAPGYTMYTTNGSEGYRYVNGTSFSAPAVAGVATLVKSYHGQADWREVKARVLAGVDPLVEVAPYLASGGRVNALRALTVSPQPVLTVAQWQSESPSGGDQWVAGEEAQLAVTLENHWIDVTGVRASLTSLSPLVTVVEAEVAYPDLLSGVISSGASHFVVRVSDEAQGHHRFPFELTIHTDQGEPLVRPFQVEFGTLVAGKPVNGVIQMTDRDSVHSFWLTVPEGTGTLRLKTTADSNIDLIVRHAARPHYYFSSFGLEVLSSELENGTRSRYSVNPNGNEELIWLAPQPGRYWVVVANTGEVANTEYCVSAIVENPDDPLTQKESNPLLYECGDPPPPEPPLPGAGGGGAISGWWMVSLWLLTPFMRSGRQRCRRGDRADSGNRAEKWLLR